MGKLQGFKASQKVPVVVVLWSIPIYWHIIFFLCSSFFVVTMLYFELKFSLDLELSLKKRMNIKASDLCFKPWNREFPGSPVVRTQCFHCCDSGSIPGWLGNQDPTNHVARPKKKKKKKN